MTFVTGIGGFFFRAWDRQALVRWYGENLGIPSPPGTYDEMPWRQEAGTTIFNPFDADSEYFGHPSKSWMLNFRVRSLDTLLIHLRSRGVRVDVDPQAYPNGRFARLIDAEGNPIQLWEPGGTDPG